MASRVCLPQDSTDSLLEVPVMEAIQRRHSDVKLGSSQQLSSGNGGLAPPRSPELRRHSDVSPASLRELEKVCAAWVILFCLGRAPARNIPRTLLTNAFPFASATVAIDFESKELDCEPTSQPLDAN